MYPDIFENASVFIRIKKYPCPHEERFRSYPHLHGNRGALHSLEIAYEIFSEQKDLHGFLMDFS